MYYSKQRNYNTTLSKMEQKISRKALKTLAFRTLWTMWKLWMDQMYKWETGMHIIVKIEKNKLSGKMRN